MTQAEQLAAQAAQWQAAGRADMAAQLYAAALDQDPSKFAIRMQLAECLAYLGQMDPAAEQYLMVAQAYAARGRHQECMAICERIIAIAPHAFVYMSVGPMVRRVGRQARILCARAAEVHLKGGRQTDGLQMLRLGAELDPHNPDVRRQLARIYQARHMMRDAVEALADAGNLLLQAKRYDDYVEVAEQILALEPGDVDTLRDLPRVYLELNKPHDAVRMLGRLTTVSPGDIVGYEILAQAFALIGRNDKALSVLERLVEQLGATGQGDKADAILNHARYWRPTDIGFLRSLKRMEVPRPKPQALARPPREGAPEGTVVLSIADLLVDEGSKRAPVPGRGVQLTEADGMATLDLEDLMLDEMEQASGMGVSPPTTPPAGRSPPPPPPGRKKRPPPEANPNATMSLDASDLIEAMSEIPMAAASSPWPDAPTRPEREVDADAFAGSEPGLATVALQLPDESLDDRAREELPTVAPPGRGVARPSISELIYDDDDGDADVTSSVGLHGSEEDEPATLLHMKPLTPEDIERAIASQQAKSAAPPEPAPPPQPAAPPQPQAWASPQPVPPQPAPPPQPAAPPQPQAWAPPPQVAPEPLPSQPAPVAQAWSPPPQSVPPAWSPPPAAPPAAYDPEPPPIAPERPAPSGGMGDEAATMARLTPLTAADIARALSQGSSTRPPPGAVNEDAVTVPPASYPPSPASYSPPPASHSPPPASYPPPPASYPPPPASYPSGDDEPEPPPLLPITPRPLIDTVDEEEDEEEMTAALQALRPADLLRFTNRGGGGDGSSG